jgi:hypothetical protein
MSHLTVDDATLALLGQAKDLVELRDGSGRVIGFFAPVSLEQAHRYAAAAARVDPTEMQRRKSDGQPGRSTAEVLQHLQSLEAGE